VSAEKPDPSRGQARQVDHETVAVHGPDGSRADLDERCSHAAGAAPDDRERLAGDARHRVISADDDGGLLAGDRGYGRAEPLRVVEVDVRDRGDPTVPGVRRVEAAAEPHLDDGEIDRLAGEPAERQRGHQLELGGRAVATGDTVGRRKDLGDELREGRGRDRTFTDAEPLAVRHQVGLRRVAGTTARGDQAGRDERHHAPLPVRAPDERAADPDLGAPQLAQEGAGPTEPQANAEPAARLEAGHGARVRRRDDPWPGLAGGVRRGHRRPRRGHRDSSSS
jgi:hypothetical protein